MKFSVFTICSLLLFNHIQKGRSKDECAPPTLCGYNTLLCFICPFDNARHPQDVCRLDRIVGHRSRGISDVVSQDYTNKWCRFRLSLTKLEDGMNRFAIAVSTKNDYTSSPLTILKDWYIEKVRKITDKSPTMEMAELNSESSPSETRQFVVKCEMLNAMLELDCPGKQSKGGENSVNIMFTLENGAKTQTCKCWAWKVEQKFSRNWNSKIIFETFTQRPSLTVRNDNLQTVENKSARKNCPNVGVHLAVLIVIIVNTHSSWCLETCV